LAPLATWRFKIYLLPIKSIEKLVQAGILREITGYARNQIYRADEIFSAIDSLQD
jgi:hypothetical protein